jgi:hypothetical protein
MKKSKIAGLVLAGILVATPAVFAGGLGDVNFPDSRFNAGGIENRPVSAHSGSGVHFYGLTGQSHSRVGTSLRIGGITHSALHYLTNEIR